jgi:predicted DsbA family dithiol-disulfide isomerase
MSTLITPTPVRVAAGTIAVFSDLTCPFAHIAIHRLFVARERLDAAHDVRIDHHAFPIELLNRAPGTRHGSDSEVPVLGPLEPDAGWQIWQGPDYHYPSTILLAFEAVQAVKAQSLEVSERFDRAVRRAFWAESRPIHLHDELLSIAATVDGVEVAALDDALRTGTYRSAVFDDLDTVRSGAVRMSPHLFLPDGTDITNPGIEVHWQGEWAKGFPVVDGDDPSIVEALVAAAR